MYICMHIYMYICVYVNIYIYLHMYIYVSRYIYTHLFHIHKHKEAVLDRNFCFIFWLHLAALKQ